MSGGRNELGKSIRLKQNLAELLDRSGIRAAELARQSGVPKQVLSLWLGGVEPRKLSHLKAVARVFGLTIDELCYAQIGEIRPKEAEPPPVDRMEGVFEISLRRRQPGRSGS